MVNQSQADILVTALKSLENNKAKIEKSNNHTMISVASLISIIISFTTAYLLDEQYWVTYIIIGLNLADFIYCAIQYLIRTHKAKQLFNRPQAMFINFLEKLHDNNSQFSGYVWVKVEELHIIVTLDKLQMLEDCSLIKPKGEIFWFSIKLKSQYLKKAKEVLVESLSNKTTSKVNTNSDLKNISDITTFIDSKSIDLAA